MSQSPHWVNSSLSMHIRTTIHESSLIRRKFVDLNLARQRLGVRQPSGAFGPVQSGGGPPHSKTCRQDSGSPAMFIGCGYAALCPFVVQILLYCMDTTKARERRSGMRRPVCRV
jgi:hypothetical protein